MKPNNLWLGFDIQTHSGPTLRPTKIEFWKDHQFKNIQPEDPFHYKADALVGLSLIHLNQHLQNPFTTPQMSYPFANELWLALEPHHEMYVRSQPRVLALRKHIKDADIALIQNFERNFTEVLDSGLHNWGIDLQHLAHLVDSIDFLEIKMGRPLMFNYGLKLSKPLLSKLHFLHSLLFNLRALIAMDYNAWIQDPTHEAVKIDSITDYLPKADYIANDAALYWNFKKSKGELATPIYEKLHKLFQNYSHNAVCLVENLPKSFLQETPQEHIEETLYLTEMDWLLATDSGLLFRIREELYALNEGYEKIFWPEVEGRKEQPAHRLTVNCRINESEIFPSSEVA